MKKVLVIFLVLAIAGVAVLIAVLPAFYLLYVLFGHPSPEVTE